MKHRGMMNRERLLLNNRTRDFAAFFGDTIDLYAHVRLFVHVGGVC